MKSILLLNGRNEAWYFALGLIVSKRGTAGILEKDERMLPLYRNAFGYLKKMYSWREKLPMYDELKKTPYGEESRKRIY